MNGAHTVKAFCGATTEAARDLAGGYCGVLDQAGITRAEFVVALYELNRERQTLADHLELMHKKLAEDDVHLPDDWREAKTLEAIIDGVTGARPWSRPDRNPDRVHAQQHRILVATRRPRTRQGPVESTTAPHPETLPS